MKTRRIMNCGSALIVLGLLIGACSAPPIAPLPRTVTVTLLVDGEQRELTSEAPTVRALLSEASLSLGDLDTVSPPEITALTDKMTITVVRVIQSSEVVTQTVPFGRQVVRDAEVPEGETRLLQSGQSGVLARHYRITFEDSVEAERVLIREELVQEPRDEVRLTGTQVQLQNVPIIGTLAYLSNQDAWVIRGSSFQTRRLTNLGNLDGRVFSLSSDGSRLIFTRATTETEILNELWVVRTTEAAPDPLPLGLGGVLWAAWSPVADQIAWSTAEVNEQAPGWRGRNDLWRATVTERNTLVSRREIREAEAGGGYGWWGTRYVWAPDGRSLAYSRPESVGIVDLLDGTLSTIVEFAAFRTYSSWSWNPEPAWSADSSFMAVVVHDSSDPEKPEESPVFSLLLAEAPGTYSATLAMEVGMWSTPRFAPDSQELLFGRATIPYQSATSPYALYLTDRDGSGQRQLYLAEDNRGLDLPEWSWSPDGSSVVFVEHGDVKRLTLATSVTEALTDDGNVMQFAWR